MKRKRYSVEEKTRLVNLSLNGESLRSISDNTGIHVVLLSRWRKEYRDNGLFGHKQNIESNMPTTIDDARIEIKYLERQLDDKTLEVMVLRDMLKKKRD